MAGAAQAKGGLRTCFARRSWLCIVLLVGSLAAAAHADWQRERWVADGFTDALGGGPAGGAVEQASGAIAAICGAADGTRFLISGQFVDIVTPDGIRRHLAGTGTLGYRDGAAHQAQFRFGLAANYGAHNMACGPSGDVFVADSGNRRIRRIHERNGEWFVSTWAGGGTQRPGIGERAPANAVSFTGTISVAVTPNGEVTVASSPGYFRVSAEGATITYLGRWPESTSRRPGKPARLNVQMGDADQHGNVYFVSRTPDVVIRIDPDGKAIHLAGVLVNGRKPHHLGDGVPREVFFDTPNSLVAAPDGSAVYVAGGDEYDIRRIPADGTGSTATLGHDGRWHIASRHPNLSRGAAVMRPAARDRLQPEGDVTVLMINQMAGRDHDGSIYGMLRNWTGRTQYVEGEGLLGTKVFRLSAVREGG